MSEGREIREAYDGPTVTQEALIEHMSARIAEEHERSSDASESSAEVAAFIDETGLNSQAYSWGKTILKKLPKKDGQHKAMDVIRSLKTILPMLEAHVGGQGTVEMDLGEDEAEDSPDPEALAAAQAGEAPTDPDLIADTEDFDAAADQALQNNVVTPIDFGATA